MIDAAAKYVAELATKVANEYGFDADDIARTENVLRRLGAEEGDIRALTADSHGSFSPINDWR